MAHYSKPFIAVCVVLAASCGTSADVGEQVERAPLGAEVAVTRQDGGVVQGTLTEKDEALVKIDVGPVVRDVPTTDIAAVQIVDDSVPMELPPEARFREVTVAPAMPIEVRLTTALNSKSSTVNQTVDGVLAEALVVDGTHVVPAGAAVSGVVTAVEPAGKVKGRASLSLAFRTLTVEGHEAPYPIDARMSLVADATKADDAAKIATPTVGGAIIGGLIGGKKGAVIGGVIGGGAGTAVVLTTTGEEVVLPLGTVLRLELAEPVDIRVPIPKVG
jgi:hypothetical protein